MKLLGRICAAGNAIGGVSERTASGAGPLRVMAGTGTEAIHVEVMPSGAYVIQIVDTTELQQGVPTKRRFGIRLRTGKVVHRQRITGKLKGGNVNDRAT